MFTRQGAPAGGRTALLAAALARLAPRLPVFETQVVLDRAMASPGLSRATPENAVWLSLVAYARHACTDYDELLEDDYDRDSARHFVLEATNAALADWGCTRQVSDEADDEEPANRS